MSPTACPEPAGQSPSVVGMCGRLYGMCRASSKKKLGSEKTPPLVAGIDRYSEMAETRRIIRGRPVPAVPRTSYDSRPLGSQSLGVGWRKRKSQQFWATATEPPPREFRRRRRFHTQCTDIELSRHFDPSRCCVTQGSTRKIKSTPSAPRGGVEGAFRPDSGRRETERVNSEEKGGGSSSI